MNWICKQCVCVLKLLLIIATIWLLYVHFFEHMEVQTPDPMFLMEESYGITTQKNITDKYSEIRKKKFQTTSMNNGVVSTNTHEAYRRYIIHFHNDYLYENIMDMKPITFDPLYKNPCWNGTSDNGPITDGKLHCLPYFYIIGVKKSGTSDLFARIVSHPEVATPASKEPVWFPRIRWNTVSGLNRGKVRTILNSDVDHRTVGFYVRQFDSTSRLIHSHPSDGSTNTKYNMITVDASPGNLMVHGDWTYLPGNEGLVEPRFTNFHYINHLNPNAKIIIIIRDPVTRLYSDFLHITSFYDTKSMNAEIFHEQVTQLTNAYKNCFSRWSMRRCIYNETLRHDFMKRGILLADSFTCGFVAFYMKEMIEVFGRDRIHTVMTMEHEHHMENSLSKIFKFLNISPLEHSKLEAIVKKGRSNAKTKKRREIGPMFNHTRDMLYNFHEPYNKDMADLMNDDRFLFRKVAK